MLLEPYASSRRELSLLENLWGLLKSDRGSGRKRERGEEGREWGNERGKERKTGRRKAVSEEGLCLPSGAIRFPLLLAPALQSFIPPADHGCNISPAS